MDWKDPTLLGAAIGVIGTLVGIVIGFAFTIAREVIAEYRNKRSIGTILYQELFDQAQAVCLCANYANAFNRIVLDDRPPRMWRNHLTLEAPADPIVFEALADKLHSLGSVAGELVACYGAIREAKRATSLLPEVDEIGDPNWKLDMLQVRIIMSWRRACELTADALDLLRGSANGPNGPDGSLAVSNLIGNLRNLAAGEPLLDNPIDDPSHTQFGP